MHKEVINTEIFVIGLAKRTVSEKTYILIDEANLVSDRSVLRSAADHRVGLISIIRKREAKQVKSNSIRKRLLWFSLGL